MTTTFQPLNTNKNSTTTNSGVTSNGTQWQQFSDGNVGITFTDGSTTTINPTLLGLTLAEALELFENQMQTNNSTLSLSDNDYLELIEDLIGGLPGVSGNTNTDAASLVPGAGLANGLALLPIFMSFSSKGLQNLTSVLGFFPMPTLNSLGQYIVGFQHILDANELPFFNSFPTSISTGIQMLLGDVQNIHMPLIQNLIRVPVTQSQFDSMVGSSAAMGPTRFANSGIPAAVNSGDTSNAGDIRECYNATNGEYDPTKGFAANTQAMGLKDQTDNAGTSAIADPQTVSQTSGPAQPISSPMTTPAPGLTDAINGAAKTSTSMPPQEMASALYGIANTETSMGNNLVNPSSSAGGPFQFTKGTWLSDVKAYGSNVPGLESYATALNNNPSVAVQNQVAQLRYDQSTSAKVLVQAIQHQYVPMLQSKGLPVTLGGIWNAHYLPAQLSQNYASQLNWSSTNAGSAYAAKYYK